MSIQTLFGPNGFELYCETLNAKEVIAGDIVNPTAIIDDLYTDRIRSGTGQNIVMDLSSGSAVYQSDIRFEQDQVYNIGEDDSAVNGMYVNTIHGPGVNPVILDPGIKFPGANQGLLANYYKVGPLNLQVEGAIITSAQCLAAVIGGIVTLSIELPITTCTAATQIDIIGLPGAFWPLRTIAGNVNVQTNTGVYADGLFLLVSNGEISIFAGPTTSDVFTPTHQIGLGYPNLAFFNFSYNKF